MALVIAMAMVLGMMSITAFAGEESTYTISVDSNDTHKYDVETCFDPGMICSRETAAEAVLLDVFWDESSEILKIPAGEQVTLLGYDEGFVLAEYWGYRGYMPMDCLK